MMPQRSFALISLCLLVALALAACGPATPAAPAPEPERQITPAILEALREQAQTDGHVAVIASFAVADLDPAMDDQTRAAAISREREALLQRLANYDVRDLKTYEYLPMLAAAVDRAGLEALANDQRVITLEADRIEVPELNDSVGLIRADFNHIAAYTGANQAIAILDTGVDRFHPDLVGKVVAGGCYSTNAANTTSTCPNGATSSTTLASSGACTGSASCDHGTHVAAIAARVAPGAQIIAIQVFSLRNDLTFCNSLNRTNPCVTSAISDQIAGLNRVFALRNTFNIAAVNMSLGAGRYFDSFNCDNDNLSRRNAIQQLRDAGIITVASAGNSGFTNSMGAPGCLSNVLSVAASDKNNQIASYSNLSAFTNVIAPGSAIMAAVPGTGNPPPRAEKNGTSMAAPHVAGVVALLRQAQPNASVAQIINAIQNTGLLITDNRLAQPNQNIPAGAITKRRVDAFAALCQLITCDSDDFRIIQANQPLNGAINPANDVDNYYFFGNVGDRLTIRLNRTSGTLNPFLELFSPNNVRVAFNADGGGGVNSLINGYTLPQSGRYVIRARGITGTGNYQLTASRETVPQNPTPRITSLSPGTATATPFGSDFWVAIYGEGFMPESEVRWNGQLRAKFYSNANLIYIRVRGSDINVIPTPPRLAFVTVRNPTPGGGTSNSYPFNVSVPFLGETELVLPDSGSGIEAGLRQTFVISWTHPTDSWRTMQRMDLRLRDPESGRVALWLRVVERPNDPEAEFPSTTFRLLDATAGSGPSEDTFANELEGVPGSGPDLTLPGLVTVHMDESRFSGSGMTAIMSPTVSFDPSLVGTYNLEFEVDSKTPLDAFGNLQTDDVLGTFQILPIGCSAVLGSLELIGPDSGTTGLDYTFTAELDLPLDPASLTYRWSPEPSAGQGTPEASFRWDAAGEQVVSLNVTHCSGFAAAITDVAISSQTEPDLSLSLTAPPVVRANEPFSYTLTVRNAGATMAEDLLLRMPLPAGAEHLEGGTLVDDMIEWELEPLAGIGATTTVSFSVRAASDLSASGAVLTASNAAGVTIDQPFVTRIVGDLALLDPADADPRSLVAEPITVQVAGGAIFEPALLALSLPPAQAVAPAADEPGPGPRFTLTAYTPDGQPSALTFFAPLTVSVAAAAFGEGEPPERVLLYALESTGWAVAGSCTPEAGGVTCELAPGATATPYALVGSTPNRVYLPVLVR